MLDNLSLIEILVIVVIAIAALGPDRIPEVARSIRKFMLWKNRVEYDVRSHLDPLLRQPPPPRPPAPPPQAAPAPPAGPAPVDAGYDTGAASSPAAGPAAEQTTLSADPPEKSG